MEPSIGLEIPPKCRICKSTDVEMLNQEVYCKTCRIIGCRFTQVVGAETTVTPMKKYDKLIFDQVKFLEDYKMVQPTKISDGKCCVCKGQTFYISVDLCDKICKSCQTVQGEGKKDKWETYFLNCVKGLKKIGPYRITKSNLLIKVEDEEKI